MPNFIEGGQNLLPAFAFSHILISFPERLQADFIINPCRDFLAEILIGEQGWQPEQRRAFVYV
ncbi:MAG: hypothetical protein LBC86_06360 [Oscillospiraceae bacterium]|nr:hypothetical protein [Oscillospiraceae bacterium]